MSKFNDLVEITSLKIREICAKFELLSDKWSGSQVVAECKNVKNNELYNIELHWNNGEVSISRISGNNINFVLTKVGSKNLLIKKDLENVLFRLLYQNSLPNDINFLIPVRVDVLEIPITEYVYEFRNISKNELYKICNEFIKIPKYSGVIAIYIVPTEKNFLSLFFKLNPSWNPSFLMFDTNELYHFIANAIGIRLNSNYPLISFSK